MDHCAFFDPLGIRLGSVYFNPPKSWIPHTWGGPGPWRPNVASVCLSETHNSTRNTCTASQVPSRQLSSAQQKRESSPRPQTAVGDFSEWGAAGDPYNPVARKHRRQYRGPGFRWRRASQVVVSPTFVELFQSKLGEPVPGALDSSGPWAATVR